MLVKLFSCATVCLITISIYGLFAIKDKVINLHYQLSNVAKQLNEENNIIHILKAEQSYLTSPARLRKLSALYLQLDNVKISQMISDPLSLEKRKYANSAEEIDPYTTNDKVKWRYKTIINDKYIQTISNKKVN
jgi:hypothetical protein